ncbi:hypothetical protein P4U23_06555 [Aeribacillus composti]|nr:hypothetical protein [Aeribacillus composti]
MAKAIPSLKSWKQKYLPAAIWALLFVFLVASSLKIYEELIFKIGSKIN